MKQGAVSEIAGSIQSEQMHGRRAKWIKEDGKKKIVCVRACVMCVGLWIFTPHVEQQV